MYKYKLLVIDDEQKILDLFQDYFGKRQFEVETANNGMEGLDKLLTGKFDATIVDLRMPDMDGMQVIEEAMNQRVPVSFIVLTGHGELPDAIKAINTDVQGWFSKPVDMASIYQRTLDLCRGYYESVQEVIKIAESRDNG
jgi:DNA-binding response OmpR family regulator